MWQRPSAWAPDRATISRSSKPMRLKMARRWVWSLAPSGKRPSGVHMDTSRSVRPGRQGMEGPCISWMAQTPARVQRSE